MEKEDKIILGISFGFNPSASIVSGEKGVLAAVSQERMNGEKNTRELPIDAIIACCKESGVRDIDVFAYNHWRDLTVDEVLRYCPVAYKRVFVEEYDKMTRGDVSKIHVYGKMSVTGKLLAQEGMLKSLKRILAGNGVRLKAEYMQEVNHHEAHRYSSYGVYGKRKKHISIVSDGFGIGVSTTIVMQDNHFEACLKSEPLINSVGLLYQFVTGALGFKEHQHEGKITGLAAYGKATCLYEFKNTLYEREEADPFGYIYNIGKVDRELLLPLTEEQKRMVDESMIVDFDLLLRLKNTVYDLVQNVLKEEKQENIAATVQKLAEMIMVKWIEQTCGKIVRKVPCYLSGGLFANVKLNQRIRELGLFSEVLVAPPMGDEGTAIGCAMYVSEMLGFEIPEKIDGSVSKVLSGTKMEYDWHEIYYILQENFKNRELKGCKFKAYTKYEELIDVISSALAEKKIVCLCEGNMEFGPRALCNRSILYDCTKESVNKWLNEQLGRTEFMPFAPVCRAENASRLFEGIEGYEETAKFMTMTFNCTDEFKQKYKAAAHIDGTARPQLVSIEENKLMYDVLLEYENKTGKEALINTSFNLHNHPIIESAKVAVDSWLKSGTDMLVINNVVFELNKREE